jgi:hypothetical protein
VKRNYLSLISLISGLGGKMRMLETMEVFGAFVNILACDVISLSGQFFFLHSILIKILKAGTKEKIHLSLQVRGSEAHRVNFIRWFLVHIPEAARERQRTLSLATNVQAR